MRTPIRRQDSVISESRSPLRTNEARLKNEIFNEMIAEELQRERLKFTEINLIT